MLILHMVSVIKRNRFNISLRNILNTHIFKSHNLIINKFHILNYITT